MIESGLFRKSAWVIAGVLAASGVWAQGAGASSASPEAGPRAESPSDGAASRSPRAGSASIPALHSISHVC